MPSRPVRTAEANRKIGIYLALSAVTLVVLLITLATAGQELTLRCNRLDTGEVDCTARKSILGIITLSSKTIGGVQAVSLGQQCVDVDCKYRLEMYSTQGLVPVNEQYTTNYDQQIKLKDQINNFFKDKTSTFVEMREETNPILIMGVVVVAVLIWAYLAYLARQARHSEEIPQE